MKLADNPPSAHRVRVTQSPIADLGYDEPFADSSQIPTHVVCALTRKHVTVALSGDGGDELLAGYNRYRWAERIWKPMARTHPGARRLAAAAIRAVPTGVYDRLGRMVRESHRVRQLGHKAHRVADLITLPDVDAIYRRLVSHIESPADFVPGRHEVCTPVWNEDLHALVPDAIDRMRYLDMRTYLPDDILTKVDRASMVVGLEVRVQIEAAWHDLQAGSDRFQYGLWNVLMFQSWQQTWNLASLAPAKGATEPPIRTVAGHA